ncbi:MAG: hypothetical protein KatS3mg057_1120 [Herpetosiphonaceae bacterium]|nr:MAG: hypothetical protein KatS3mg057_1120 [Herpetosiphonaceae bacterium]
MTTVIGLFERQADAEQVIDELERSGFDKTTIGILARDRFLNERMVGGDPVLEDTAQGIAGGAAVGGLTGLLAGAVALAVPGIGPILAAGTLATLVGSTAAGAGIGAVAGGVIGALTGLGVSEEEAEIYAEGIKRGGVLIAVETLPEQVGQIWQIMRRMNAVDINTRRAEWEQSGWTRFEEDKDPDEDNPRFTDYPRV